MLYRKQELENNVRVRGREGSAAGLTEVEKKKKAMSIIENKSSVF